MYYPQLALPLPRNNTNHVVMKKRVLLLFISTLCFIYANAQSFRDDFGKALNAKDMKKAEAILKAWDLDNANDPELYVAFFNFYTVRSMEAGMLSANGYDVSNSKQALEYISEGIERFPIRLDMRIAKIYMLGELNSYQAYVEEILQLIAYSDKIKNNWKEVDFLLVSYPVDMFFGVVADCQENLFLKEDPALFKDIIRISDEMLKYYPKHIQSHIASSTVYVAQKEYDKSLAKLMEALQIEPANAILSFNIAYVYEIKGDKANAKKYYELSITNCSDKEEELKEAAKSQLKAL